MMLFSAILRTPTTLDVVLKMLVFLGPLSIAFLLGMMVGWSWKPRWVPFANFKKQNPNQDTKIHKEPFKLQNPSCSSSIVKKEENRSLCSSSIVKKENHLLTDEDLKQLRHLVEKRDGGPPWKHMMDHSTPDMTYQAWQRDPETGPPQYCSRTVYEDATPESLRDFFWDDDFRLKWDDMLLHGSTLEEFPAIGASVVHWIRKFPFFCSDREYTIGRRIWELDGSFYCVTKGVPCDSIPRKQKPRRVDLYYSSWFIQPVESKKGKPQPACEVTFFHHEDMGIPWEIAKFGVRQGMWGAARKVERGLRLYQKERASSKTISLHVVMAQMSTKIDQAHLARLESIEDEGVAQTEMVVPNEKQGGMNMPKLLVIGGAVALACSLDRGLLTKTVIFGVARRFGNIGRRALPPRQL